MLKNETIKQMLAWKLGSILLRRIQASIMLSMLVPGKGELILDGGCGRGNLSYEMKKRGARVIGIDISRNLLRKAKSVSRFAEGESTFIVGSLTCLPIRSDSFDKVLLSSVLQHILDYKKALQEIQRVLKTGGILVINVLSDRLFLYLPCMFGKGYPTVEQRLWKEYKAYHKWSAKALAVVLKKMGFNVLYCEYSPKFFASFFYEVNLIFAWIKISRRWEVIRFLLFWLSPLIYQLSKLDYLLPRETGGSHFTIKVEKTG